MTPPEPPSERPGLPSFEEGDRRELRARFHHAIDGLDDDLVATALVVVEALPRLTDGFFAGDVASIGDARSMAQGVYDRCRAVEDAGFVLLAREAPVAQDLRRLVALLRLALDVDRSARLLQHVSETLKHFNPRELPEDLRLQVRELADRSFEVFRRGIDAWRQADALAIVELQLQDSGVDRLQSLIRETAAAHGGDELLVLGLITRYYERIADHGVAFAEEAVFVVTGDRLHSSA